MIRNHALLPLAGDQRAVDAELAPRITEAALPGIVAEVPDDWLAGPEPPDALRRGLTFACCEIISADRPRSASSRPSPTWRSARSARRGAGAHP
jgi:hypothetical protein